MAPRVYLDFNATAPLRAEAREAMIAAMDVMGNPSSVHAVSRRSPIIRVATAETRRTHSHPPARLMQAQRPDRAIHDQNVHPPPLPAPDF